MLRVEAHPLLPLLTPPTQLLLPENLTVSEKLHQPLIELPLAQKIAERRQVEQERDYNRSRIYSLPFRQAKYWIRRGFLGLRGLFSDEGFISLRVQHRTRKYKLDRDFAWALENGAAFDRILRRQPF